jgi:hypothetical protein
MTTSKRDNPLPPQKNKKTKNKKQRNLTKPNNTLIIFLCGVGKIWMERYEREV